MSRAVVAAGMALIAGACALPPQQLARIPPNTAESRADYPLLVCVYEAPGARYGYEVYVTAETRCAGRASLAARITFQASAGASYIVRYRPLGQEAKGPVRFSVTDEATGTEIASTVAQR